MLEKIADIRFNNQMNENKNGYKSARANSHSSSSKSNHFDSINISPAFHFMSRFNAKVLNIFNNVSDKYELVFELDNFVFDLIIDLPNLFERNEVQFKIKSKIPENSNPNIFLKINVGNNFELEEVSTKNIALLFQKIDEAGLTNKSTLFDPELIHFLIDGIEEKVLSNLKVIAGIGILFIEKLFEIKIVEKLNIKSDIDNIKIQLIKSSDFMGLQNSE